MKRMLSLPLILALFLSPVLAQNKIQSVAASDPKELVGRYIYSSGFVNATYKISDDGKFEYFTGSDCCDPVWSESGSYAVRDTVLHFKITTKKLNDYNLLDPKQAAEAYRKIYDRKAAELPTNVSQTEYDMQIVRWGGRIYLVDPDRLNIFAAAVNFGIEPRIRIIDRNFLTTRFFLRVGDQDKEVIGKPILPEPWLSYLHDFPVKAAVKKIELRNKERIYTVNKGSTDGLKVGMLLNGENTNPDIDNVLFVISVEESSATLKSSAIYRAADYQLGNILVSTITKTPR